MARIPSNPELKCFWLHSQPEGRAFYSTPKSGKWCMSFPVEEADAAWERVDALVAAGKIRAAMVSTAWGAKQRGFDTLVICVFTDDWQDKVEVSRVRKVLLEEGFKVTMGYKRDIDTVTPESGAPEFVYGDADFAGSP